MIEIEKKFVLSPEEEKRLLTGAEFLGETRFTDVYYDFPDFRWLKRDSWLRFRDGRPELKLSLAPHGTEKGKNRSGDLYEEIDDKTEVCRRIGLGGEGNLHTRLLAHGCVSYCTVATIRRKYKKSGFGIDVDRAEYGGGLSYHLCEIELMRENESEAGEALDRILAFAKKHGIPSSRVHGKILWYLREAKPELYREVRAAWGIEDVLS